MATQESPAGSSKKFRSDTMWRLVQAGCEQLAHAVGAARLPMILMLTWCLVWFMSIYEHETGMFTKAQVGLLKKEWMGSVRMKEQLRRELETRVRMDDLPPAIQELAKHCGSRIQEPATAGQPAPAALFAVQQLMLCDRDLAAHGDVQGAARMRDYVEARWATLRERDLPPGAEWAFYRCVDAFQPGVPLAQAKLASAEVFACGERAQKRLESVLPRQIDLHFVSLPLDIGRTSVNDMGLIGTLTLLLFLTWAAYAMRAEYEAIRTFVDFREPLPLLPFASPRKVELHPQGARWQAEHLAFAFHAVRARLFSAFRGRRLLKTWNALVLVFPLIVIGWQAYSDVSWLVGQDPAQVPDFHATAKVRTIVAIPLMLVVLALWWRIATLVTRTSDVLQAWSLATEHVWMRQWNEDVDTPPHIVQVDLQAMSAEAVAPMPWPREFLQEG